MNSEAGVEAAAEKTRRIDNLYRPTSSLPRLAALFNRKPAGVKLQGSPPAIEAQV